MKVYEHSKVECNQSDIDSHLESYGKVGYELVSCTCIQPRQFKVYDLGHTETPARFLLIFKRFSHND
jgi:hypothetical protein